MDVFVSTHTTSVMNILQAEHHKFAPVPPFFTTSVHMSLQLRPSDTWLPRFFSRFLAASFRWNVPSSCRTRRPIGLSVRHVSTA